LEGEDEQSLAQMSLFHERVLPDLANNIKCGNSLIGPDFYDNQQMTFDEEEVYRINVFDWNAEFPEIMKNGGFDAVIGNPPYLKLTLNNSDRHIADYYNLKYQSVSGGSSKNLFQLFIEKMLDLQPETFSFIVPEALLTTLSNKLIRLMMLQKMNLTKLAVFDKFVFKNATIGSAVFILDRKKQSGQTIVEKLYPTDLTEKVKELKIDECCDIWESSSKNEFDIIIDKIKTDTILMDNLANMSKGMVVKDRITHLRSSPEKADLPFLLGSCIKKYQIEYKYFTNYDELTIIGGTKELNKQLRTPRLLIRRTGKTLCVAYSPNKELIESTLYILTSDQINLKYLLGILNSDLLTFYLKQKLITNIQGFPQVLMGQLKQLPIRIVDPLNRSSHDQIVSLVDRMLDLHKKLNEANLPQAKTVLARQIEATDRQIDRLVYQLYDLTEEEIKIVEGEV